jgi:MFS family permease
MNSGKLRLNQLLLLVLPAAFLEALNQIYNLYVPVYIQAGGANYSKTLTLGFGFGALVTGIWMVADNLWGFAVQTFVGAWSDRTKSKRGRRIPFVIWTLPFVVLGYAAIPYIPTLITPETSGKSGMLIPLIIAFTLACVIFYIGWCPVRLIFMAMRQEAVEVKDRVKVESWWNFAVNVITIIAYTAGAMLYRSYGPSLFWLLLVCYVICVVWLVFKYKEAPELSQAADDQEKSNLKQLKAVFNGASKADQKNLIWFLASVIFFCLAVSGYTNFNSSWIVNVLGMDESKSSIAISMITIATTIAVLPAGYIAAGKFGRRNMYIIGIAVMIVAGLIMAFAPALYMIGFILIGIGAGMAFPSQLPLATEMAPQNGKMASVISVYNLAYLTGFISGSWIIGGIIDATSYKSLYFGTTTMLIISLVLFLFAKAPSKKTETEPQPAAAD